MDTTKEAKLYKVAEVELIYKSNVKASERPKITSPKDAYEIFRESWDHSKLELLEQFKVMLTNRANKVLGILDISAGGISGTLVDVRLIFAAAIKGAASGIVIAHNHPSGNLQPSQPDIDLTRKIKECGKLLDIPLLEKRLSESLSRRYWTTFGVTFLNPFHFKSIRINQATDLQNYGCPKTLRSYLN